MSLSTLRESSIILTDYTNFVPWLNQIKARSQVLKIWNIIDPDQQDLPRVEPTIPTPPKVSSYQPSTSFTTATPDESPSLPSHLSTSGLKAYKDDTEYYRGQLELYKIMERKYEEEQSRLDKITTVIQSTVSTHLQNNCCLPTLSIREWIKNLIDTVGIDVKEEYDRARKRYYDALKPMRSAAQWQPWLAEYDHAATEAETNGVTDLQRLDSVKQDFVKAVSPIAPMWATTFMQTGSKLPTITRKDTMKLFREHMALQHPIKGKQKGAFAAAESFLAEGSASTPATDRDASLVVERAPNRGRPRKQRLVGQEHQTTSKRSAITVGPAAAGGLKCPACELRHNLQDCFYVFPENQPEWFKPRPGIMTLMKYRLENDVELQASLRAIKRVKSPTFKQSHTPTPTRITDVADKE